MILNPAKDIDNGFVRKEEPRKVFILHQTKPVDELFPTTAPEPGGGGTEVELMKGKIRVLIKEPGFPCRLAKIPNRLKALQEVVGGYVEVVQIIIATKLIIGSKFIM